MWFPCSDDGLCCFLKLVWLGKILKSLWVHSKGQKGLILSVEDAED